MNKKEKSINEITKAFTKLSFIFSKASMNAHDLTQAISELYAEWEARKNRFYPIVWWGYGILY
jgi:hypothetical protein